MAEIPIIQQIATGVVLKLDTVSGAELDVSVFEGRLIRTGLILGLPLVSGPPDPTVLIQALQSRGMPQIGDRFPHPSYHDYFCKRHIIRPVNAGQATVVIIYEWMGQMTISDSSTLSSAPTQLFPADFDPLYVTYDPGGGKPVIRKLLTLNTQIPLRHVTVSKTVDFTASDVVLSALGAVNIITWMGLPAGYWLCTALEGSTMDNGITYTYTAVFTTKQREDWSQLGYMTDDIGHAIYVDPADVMALRARPYLNLVDITVNGIIKVGMYPMLNLETIFGIH